MATGMMLPRGRVLWSSSPRPAVQQTIGDTDKDKRISFGDFLSLGNGYAVAICGGRSVAVDLRRAKERIVYDGCMAVVGVGALPSQQLLFPERLVLSQETMRCCAIAGMTLRP